MSVHIHQALHNEDFHKSLCSKFSEKYFDWKITCLFYVSYHVIKAIADVKGVDIGNRHTFIRENINPKNPKRKLQIKNDVFEAYDALFEYSWMSRYDGFTDLETFQEIKKMDYNDAIRRCNYIKSYAVRLGVSFE